MIGIVRRRPVELPTVALLVVGTLAATSVFAQGKGSSHRMGDKHTTSAFKGAKVNGGTVTHEMKDGKHVLTWSDDFKIPDTPAPHWQVMDSKGNVYLLQRLKIKDDKVNRTITVPAYVPDIAKVQIWCAWAEALLGEASFDHPVN